MSAHTSDFLAAFVKDKNAYAYTDRLTDTDWAWEFLRRNPDYQKTFYEERGRPVPEIKHASGVRLYRDRKGGSQSQNWGLAMLASPDLNALQTDIFWKQAALTHRVAATASRVQSSSAKSDLDLFRDQNCCAILCGLASQKIIIRSRNAAIDMKLVGINILFQPVKLQFQVDGFSSLSHDTNALIWTKNALKSFRSGDKKNLTRTTRLHRKKYLIALDCAQSGGSLRDTAHVFQALGLTRLSWSASGNEALKKQVWRCRNMGLKLMQGTYRNLL